MFELCQETLWASMYSQLINRNFATHQVYPSGWPCVRCFFWWPVSLLWWLLLCGLVVVRLIIVKIKE